MHRILHAAIASFAVLLTSNAARAVNTPSPPLLKTDSGLTYRAWLPPNFSRRRHDVPVEGAATNLSGPTPLIVNGSTVRRSNGCETLMAAVPLLTKREGGIMTGATDIMAITGGTIIVTSSFFGTGVSGAGMTDGGIRRGGMTRTIRTMITTARFTDTTDFPPTKQ